MLSGTFDYRMNILAIIPARAGSKRLPGKNTKSLHGKPLFFYAIEAALQSKYISRIVVSSDNKEVLQLAVQYSGIQSIQRPAELSGDHSPAIDYVKHALQILKEEFDLVVILQPSSPLTLPEDIDGTIHLLLQHPEADSSVSVMKLDHSTHPVKLKVMQNNLLLPYLEEENGRMASHELPELYVRNCAVYVSRNNTIAKGQIVGHQCLGYLMPRERSVDINDPIDFAFAEFLIKKILS
jgi:CMP-N,N'-diacetyllegionaminic acid synthase